MKIIGKKKNQNILLFIMITAIIVLVIGIIIDVNKSNNEFLSKLNNTNVKNPSLVGNISFEEEIYNCVEGEKIDTVITATSSNSNSISTVNDYKSNNTSIAEIQENEDYSIKCVNCLAVRINCKKSGTTTIKATSTTGAKVAVKVVVEKTENEIASFEKNTYICKTGETISTYLSTNIIHNSYSFSSSNDKIAKISRDVANINCKNCNPIVINCLREGKATLTATATTGLKTTADIIVTSPQTGAIYYANNMYVCKAGEYIDTTITSIGTDDNVISTIKSYSTSDDNIASIDSNPEYAINCINCKAVRITCKKSGSVKLYATSSLGATTTSTLTVSNSDRGSIKFANTSYTCNAGETFNTMITAYGTDTNPLATVKTYTSSNTDIATISANTDIVPNCANCVSVKVNCKKSGTVKLNATSSLGASTTSSLTVKSNDKGSIKFDKDSYKCVENESFNTMITAYGTDANPLVTVKSYASSNTDIATISPNTDIVPNCANCVSVKVNCKKTGNITLSAKSSLGATTTSKLTVEKNTKGSIKYASDSYSCYAGEQIDTIITAYSNNNKLNTVKSYSTSDSSIATVTRNPELSVKCVNCVAVRINCLKTGTVTLNAKSTLGATTTSTLTVEKNTKGSIKFKDEAYFCNEGEYINTMITAYGNDSTPLATVKSYTAEDTSIATITPNTEFVANCANCVSVIINCKKAGIVRLKATSSLGASTTSTLYVEENDKGSISFGGSSINCKKGEKINTIITAKGTNQTQPATVRSYSIQDTSIATIERSTGIAVNCANCISVEITCKKIGKTTAKAISSLGASTIIPITVEK